MKTTKQKFLNSSFMRIFIGLILCFAIFILAQQVAGKVLDLTSMNKGFRNLFKSLIASASVMLVYISFYRRYEKREVTEFSSRRLFRNIAFGIFLGTALQCLTMGVIYIFGDMELVSTNSFSTILTPFSIAFSVAVFEEILLRGIVFRIIEERFGSHISLLISAIIFGGVHLLNPGSTVISSACIGLVGLIFGALFIYSRNLWLPIAVHFSWNFVQSGIFGAVTSGNDKTSSLFNFNISGSELITGGAFGPEGTIQATLLWLVVAIVLMILITKQNKLIKSRKKQNKKTEILFR